MGPPSAAGRPSAALGTLQPVGLDRQEKGGGLLEGVAVRVAVALSVALALGCGEGESVGRGEALPVGSSAVGVGGAGERVAAAPEGEPLGEGEAPGEGLTHPAALARPAMAEPVPGGQGVQAVAAPVEKVYPGHWPLQAGVVCPGVAPKAPAGQGRHAALEVALAAAL